MLQTTTAIQLSFGETNQQAMLSVFLQFKKMDCIEPFFYLNQEILTLDFQKPKSVTNISKGLPKISTFTWKAA